MLRNTIRFLLANSLFVLVGAGAALIWANVDHASYEQLIHQPLIETTHVGVKHELRQRNWVVGSNRGPARALFDENMVIVGNLLFSIRTFLEQIGLFLMVFVCLVPDCGVLGCCFRGGPRGYPPTTPGRPESYQPRSHRVPLDLLFLLTLNRPRTKPQPECALNAI